MKISSFIAAVLIPLSLSVIAYQWLGEAFGPAQAIAYAAVRAVVALSIFFSYLRLMNILNHTNVPTWLSELHKRDQAFIYSVRLAVVGIIVAAAFIG